MFRPTVMRCLAGVWLASIATLSLAPIHVKVQLGTVGPYHDLGHLTVFVITVILLCWIARDKRAKLAWFLVTSCFGASLEWLEAAVYHHPIEWRDVLMDVIGAAVGFAVISMFPLIASAFERSEVSPES